MLSMKLGLVVLALSASVSWACPIQPCRADEVKSQPAVAQRCVGPKCVAPSAERCNGPKCRAGEPVPLACNPPNCRTVEPALLACIPPNCQVLQPTPRSGGSSLDRPQFCPVRPCIADAGEVASSDAYADFTLCSLSLPMAPQETFATLAVPDFENPTVRYS